MAGGGRGLHQNYPVLGGGTVGYPLAAGAGDLVCTQC